MGRQAIIYKDSSLWFPSPHSRPVPCKDDANDGGMATVIGVESHLGFCQSVSNVTNGIDEAFARQHDHACGHFHKYSEPRMAQPAAGMTLAG